MSSCRETILFAPFKVGEIMRFLLLLLLVFGFGVNPTVAQSKKLLSGTVHSVDVEKSSIEVDISGSITRIKFGKATTITVEGKAGTIESVSEGDKVYLVCDDN